MFDFLKGNKKVEQKPVYVINGFLDSGKTSFIRYTIGQPYFQVQGTTLLIICEEGEEEYRLWNPRRSKLAAALLNGLEGFMLKNDSKILYLGASTGTTVSHISDICLTAVMMSMKSSL